MLIKPLEHFDINAFDVGKLAPPGIVVVFSGSFKLVNKFLHQTEIALVIVPEVLFANLRCLILPILCP